MFRNFDFLVLFVTPVVLTAGLALLAGPYLSVRIQDHRSDRPDPQLGLKAACYFLFGLGVLVALVGTTTSLADVMDTAVTAVVGIPAGRGVPGPGSHVQRSAAGLAVTGLTAGLLGLGAARFWTNAREYPAVGRAYVGALFGLTALVAVTAAALLNAVMFRGDLQSVPLLSTLSAVMMVWTPAAVVLLFLLRRLSGGPYHRAEDPGEVD